MSIYFDIIVPIYNVEKYLNACIESIINQTYKNINIILVDDGSTDSSGDIAKAYAQKDNRIKYIYQSNQGAAKARNVGLEYVLNNYKNTEKIKHYVSFIDSDDCVDKSLYFKLSHILENNSVECVAFDFDVLELDGSISDGFGRANMSSYHHQIIDGKTAIENNVLPFYANVLMVYDIDFISSFRFIDDLNYEDVPFMTDILLNAKSIYIFYEKLYRYKIVPTSLTRQKNSKEKKIADFFSYYIIAKKFLAISMDEKESQILRDKAYKEFTQNYYFAVKSLRYKGAGIYTKKIFELRKCLKYKQKLKTYIIYLSYILGINMIKDTKESFKPYL